MSKKNKQLYSIGEMARLCDVSPKQLRYYDENHILSPAYRDSDTAYRYYTQSQVGDMMQIKELRSLGFSLESIAGLLNNRDLANLKAELEKSVHNAREALKESQYKYDQTVDALLRVTQAIECAYKPPASLHDENIQLVQFKSRPVLYVCCQDRRHDQFLSAEDREKLFNLAVRYGLTIAGPNLALFRGDPVDPGQGNAPASQCEMEICLAISDSGEHCPHVRVLNSFTAVSSVFVGQYQHMAPRYFAMDQWARERGYRLAGDRLEEYIAGAAVTSREENYVTRLYLPLEGFLP